MTTLRKIAAAAATVMATMGVMVVLPGSANAAQACYPNVKSFSIPGQLDPTVTIDLCVRTDGPDIVAEAHISWDRGTVGTIGTAFDAFTLNLRLEKNDADIKKATCDSNLLRAINSHRDGDYFCQTSWANKGSSKKWSADGNVVYNINNDGDGNKTWSLHGSPLL